MLNGRGRLPCASTQPPSFCLVRPRETARVLLVPSITLHTGRRSGGLVAQSAVAPPGPIPNPVVTHRSAGEYCGVAPREARPLRVPPDGRGGVQLNMRDAGWSSGSSLGS